MATVHLIALGSLFICNLVVLCLAIIIRYDKVFGNLDIQELFSRISIPDYYNLTKTINEFSIVNVTFTSVSIASVLFSIVVLFLPKWKLVLSYISIGLLCIVAFGNVIQVGLFMKFFSNVSSELEARFNNSFGGYKHSDYSAAYNSSLSLSWNTLFVQAECCGVGPNIESSFESTYWGLYPSMYNSAGQRVPVQCCLFQFYVFPYSSITDSYCTSSKLADGYFYSQSCDVAVQNRLEKYSTTFIVFMAIIILAEICCVVTTVLNAKRFKQEATILSRSIKASVEDAEIRKDYKTQKEKGYTKKKRKHGDKEAEGSSRNKRHMSVGTVDFHQRENTIVHENTGENIELHIMKSMETADTIDDKPDTSTNKRGQNENELVEKGLTLSDN